ncbi:MAG: hypothetical protein ACWGNO_08885 [Desulfobacterales bacterium]
MTYRKTLIKMVIPWMVFPVFFWAASCSQKDDVQLIRGLIKEGAALAEDHNVSGLMELTTEDVVAFPGHHNRLEIKRIIFAALMHYGKLKVLYPKPSVDLSTTNNSATCMIYLLIVKKDRTIPDLKDLYEEPRRWLEKVGENADLYQVKLQLLKKDGKWLVNQTHLEGFKGLGFSE